jgi:23S rRNA pseudouridine2605 synthase
LKPLRLARFLARAGAASRRGAADLVASGRVLVNGRAPGGPGDPVDPLRDAVTLDGRELRLASTVHLAVHKPVGYATGRVATGKFPPVFTLLEDAPRALVAVGRLDVMTSGLLLMTTDGELAARLMHPRWGVPRRYRVEVTGRLDEAARAGLERGLLLEGEERPVRPLGWSFSARPRGGVLSLELAEGRSRVVRRMCRQMGLGIRRLVRESYGPVRLGDLASGRSRALSAHEAAALYRLVRLAPPESPR